MLHQIIWKQKTWDVELRSSGQMYMLQDDEVAVYSALDIFLQEACHQLKKSSIELVFSNQFPVGLMSKSNGLFYVEMKAKALDLLTYSNNDWEIQELNEITDALYPFFEEVFSSELEKDTKRWLDDFKQITKPKTILHVVDAKLQAVLLTFSVNEHVEYIFLIGTSSMSRNQGLANSLLSQLIRMFPEKQFVLGVSYKTDAYYFYDKIGFEISKVHSVIHNCQE